MKPSNSIASTYSSNWRKFSSLTATYNRVIVEELGFVIACARFLQSGSHCCGKCLGVIQKSKTEPGMVEKICRSCKGLWRRFPTCRLAKRDLLWVAVLAALVLFLSPASHNECPHNRKRLIGPWIVHRLSGQNCHIHLRICVCGMRMWYFILLTDCTVISSTTFPH